MISLWVSLFNKVIRHQGFLSLAGTLVGTGTSLGCCAPTFVASGLSLLSGVGLGFLGNSTSATLMLYLGIGGSLANLAASAYRCRNAYPLLLGLAGAVILLLPFHDALDVTLFRILVACGLVLLVSASLWMASIGKRKICALNRGERRCANESPPSTETQTSGS